MFTTTSTAGKDLRWCCRQFSAIFFTCRLTSYFPCFFLLYYIWFTNLKQEGRALARAGGKKIAFSRGFKLT
jgi:hypothetical protein